MEIKLIFGIASTILAVVCFAPYIKDVLLRKTEPYRYSWLVWTILQTVGVMAQLKDGAGYGAWALAVGAVFCFAIFLLSFKFGTKNITKFDAGCLVASLGAIIIYFLISNPVWAIIVVATIDFVGFLPTFRKGYEEPFTETASTFVMSAIANALSLIALQNYSVTTVLYIASLLLTNSSFAAMILWRRKLCKGSFSETSPTSA
ncbi:MAG: hypothetical protein A2675_04155 [Candidatus Yonathbacteria bacterium RIFCSPHIGHO2_01_FULL_51_10]|uniref:PQ-loop repeat-containing protein n=1 Tax=Candidatus Yonathbacteria bacterium RIFCSPHIGHO2_01_FULL_51_10 TaxID=1802723 RepID=A0A1G2S5C8_9BACT|nr:MAG: hypothetical protein A2675_04155 [Candidatus Yonathbacteria bacterium RIFCSPHIGHO2_01_FULL_51_10]